MGKHDRRHSMKMKRKKAQAKKKSRAKKAAPPAKKKTTAKPKREKAAPAAATLAVRADHETNRLETDVFRRLLFVRDLFG